MRRTERLGTLSMVALCIVGATVAGMHGTGVSRTADTADTADTPDAVTRPRVLRGAGASRDPRESRTAAGPADGSSGSRAQSMPLAEAPPALRHAVTAARQSDARSDARFRMLLEGQAVRTHAGDHERTLEARFDGRGVALEANGARARLSAFAVECDETRHALAAGVPTPDPEQANRVSIERVPARAKGASIREWYVAGPLGLEQGLDVDGLACERSLRVVMRIDGMTAHAEGHEVVLASTEGQRMRVAELSVHDAEGRALDSRFELTGGLLALAVDVDAAAWPIAIDPLIYAETAQFEPTAMPSTSGAHLGQAVAIQGSYALIGAPDAGNGGVEIYLLSAGLWSRQQRIAALDGAPGDGFGHAVALDGSVAVVGAWKDDVSTNLDQGSVYVFTRSGTTWTQVAQLVASDGAGSDWFGTQVAVQAGTIVVSAPLDDVGAATDQGSAYVFTGSAGSWTLQQKLLTSDGGTNDRLGEGGFGFDGNTLVIGASTAGTGGTAYVFVRNVTTWSEQDTLQGSDTTTGDDFAWSTAFDGETAVVGAPDDDIATSTNQGSAFVFTRSGTVWTQQQKLVASDGTANDSFGQSVDIDTDTVVVGASQGVGPNGGTQGASYVLTRAGTVWSEASRLTASSGVNTDRFGVSVAIDGTRVLVGASQDDVSPGLTDDGAAFVYEGSGSAFVQMQRLLAWDSVSTDHLGASVAIDGDVAVVGAPQDDGAAGANVASAGLNAGAAYIYTRTGAVWTFAAKVVASDPGSSDSFGYAVDVDGDTVVVSAPNDDISTSANQGSVHVFVRSGGNWVWQSKLVAPDGVAGDSFGRSVAIDGDTVIAGADGDLVVAAAQGSAYVFTRNAAVWTLQQKLVAADGAFSDRFGWSVAVDGELALVGSYLNDVTVNMNQGSVYAFARSGTVWSAAGQLVATGGGVNDNFGTAIALDANRAVVAAEGHQSKGAAFVFERVGSTFGPSTKLVASDTAATESFADSVALSGDAVLVGSSEVDIGANLDQGSAYLYTIAAGVWTERNKLLASNGTAADRFGAAVALEGLTTLIGAPDRESNLAGNDTTAGTVYFGQLTRPSGEACGGTAECVNGTCVDGVCCATACGGGTTDCQACSVASGAAVDGTCGPILSPPGYLTPCRAAQGACDAAEFCDGVSTSCPAADLKVAAGIECRAVNPSLGCDAPESCDGTTNACPTDAPVAVQTLCRAAVGPCDQADLCDGTSFACPADNVSSSGTSCRPAVGPCDVTEFCTGSTATCPADLWAPPNTFCDVANGPCDATDYCTGASPICPETIQADDTSCDDQNACTTTSSCKTGVCTETLRLDCSDGDPCTTDLCSDALGTCSHVATAACGGLDAGTDASSGDDAGVSEPPPAAGGCSCVIAGGPASGRSSGLLRALGGLLLVLGVMRSRSRRSRGFGAHAARHAPYALSA